MIEVLRIDVAGIPMTKGSWKPIQRAGRTRLIPDNEGEPVWAASIAWAARAKLRGADPTKCRYAIDCDFILPLKNGNRGKRDVDKLVRSVLDALTGIVWVDDEQVDDIVAHKTHNSTMVPGVTIVCYVKD